MASRFIFSGVRLMLVCGFLFVAGAGCARAAAPSVTTEPTVQEKNKIGAPALIYAPTTTGSRRIRVPKKFTKPKPGGSPIACTQEAKQCPDRSFVRRVGPRCAYAACPRNAKRKGRSCAGPSDRSCGPGLQCLQACGPPVARNDDLPPPFYCETDEIASKPRICPICLASNTVIATPHGDVNVRDVKLGMLVWSLDTHGNKLKSRVIRISRVQTPTTHRVIHLMLSDRREVWVSPDHPSANGRAVREMRVGEQYDGSAVQSIKLVPYWDHATYDLLPDSETGLYWADGIILGSTLTNP